MERQCICKRIGEVSRVEEYGSCDGEVVCKGIRPQSVGILSGLTKASSPPRGLILAWVNPRTWKFLDEGTVFKVFWE